eukprot:CAMPEP_0182424056 /NCGR_PEP_ID=MMETSP1167-20130531/10200_1 /TAXON_ID=2988 /ORGANISM="Mallomonas Sp, Strain CCMP3275" /LENGTH=361 /DNA_ID=CAMNT_0024603569 /DNA_START=173 /DNA_END=1258 /DNA_ORIENTATION=-
MEGVSLTPKNKLFTLEETKQVISLFAELGVTKLRFTGGEPTVSKHLIPLVQYSRSLPTIQSIGITTNGILLHNQLDALQAAGLTHVNISLDTLQPARFAKIVRRDQKLLYKVLSTVFAAVTKGLSVKINCVVMRGVNVDELISFLDLTREMKVDVRFLEMMPFDDNNWDSKSLVSFFEMIDIIRQQGYEVQKQPPVDPHDTTKWYSVRSRRRAGHDPEREREREEEEEESTERREERDSVHDHTRAGGLHEKREREEEREKTSREEWVEHRGRLGFITSMSSNFCGGCNRLRITADGKLKVCLFGEEEWDLREAMRDGMSREELLQRIHEAVWRKKKQLGGHASPEALAASKNRPMILIGG